NVTSDATTVATVSRPAGQGTLPLTFTPANYNVAQTVVVSPVDDTNLVNNTANVTIASTGLTSKSVGVTVIDADQQAFVLGGLTASTLTVPENSAGTFTVRLAFDPSGTVAPTINVAPPTGVASFSPAALSFNSSNWSTPQTITVMPVVDSDTNNASATWSISA